MVIQSTPAEIHLVPSNWEINRWFLFDSAETFSFLVISPTKKCSLKADRITTIGQLYLWLKIEIFTEITAHYRDLVHEVDRKTGTGLIFGSDEAFQPKKCVHRKSILKGWKRLVVGSSLTKSAIFTTSYCTSIKRELRLGECFFIWPTQLASTQPHHPRKVRTDRKLEAGSFLIQKSHIHPGH